jgi:hypothetical protein
MPTALPARLATREQGSGSGSGLPSWQNEKVEQLAANNLTIPQDAIASLLQRLVRPALRSTTTAFSGWTSLNHFGICLAAASSE